MSFCSHHPEDVHTSGRTRQWSLRYEIIFIKPECTGRSFNKFYAFLTAVKTVPVYCADLHKLKFSSFTVCTETENSRGSKLHLSVYVLN